MPKWEEAMAQAEVADNRKFISDSKAVTTCSCGTDQSLQDARRVDERTGKKSIYRCRSCGKTLMTVERLPEGNFMCTNAVGFHLIVDPSN